MHYQTDSSAAQLNQSLVFVLFVSFHFQIYGFISDDDAQKAFIWKFREQSVADAAWRWVSDTFWTCFFQRFWSYVQTGCRL